MRTSPNLLRAAPFILSLLLTGCASTAGPVRPTLEDRLRGFERFAGEQMSRDHIPGMSIAVAKGGETWERAFGFADLENSTPARTDSSYRLASVTKPMTAVAVLQLVEKGKLDLDAEIQTYVASFPRKPFPVTVRQLLGHVGGISHYKDRDAEQHFKEHKTVSAAIAVFKDFDLVAEPGTKYSYTSYGYVLLGAAIESASGQSYGDYMREHIWQPLGMNGTRMDDPLEIIPHRVRGYQILEGRLLNSEFIDVSSRLSAGGTRSTAGDMLRFLRGVNEGRLLSPASMKAMSTQMKTRDGMPTGYGMGWNILTINGHRAYAHDGGQPETRTFTLFIPDEKIAIAFAMNLEADIYRPYIAELYRLLSGAPLEMGRAAD